MSLQRASKFVLMFARWLIVLDGVMNETWLRFICIMIKGTSLWSQPFQESMVTQCNKLMRSIWTERNCLWFLHLNAEIIKNRKDWMRCINCLWKYIVIFKALLNIRQPKLKINSSIPIYKPVWKRKKTPPEQTRKVSGYTVKVAKSSENSTWIWQGR